MLKVSPEQLQTMSGAVHRTSSDVQGAHGALKRTLEPLFGADWSGTAAAEFARLYGEFDTHASGLSRSLDGIGSLLQQAGAVYADAEQQIAASFRS